jgi:small subunit ribosomal protein S16
MAITIRMKRMGRENSPYFRIVASDHRRSAKGGQYVEEVGSYNPTKVPAIVQLDKDKIAVWLKKGATMSETVKSLLKSAGIYKEIAPVKAPKKKKVKKAAKKAAK